MISLLGLEEHLYKRISQLSGGQKQRVALARTLVVKPRACYWTNPSPRWTASSRSPSSARSCR